MPILLCRRLVLDGLFLRLGLGRWQELDLEIFEEETGFEVGDADFKLVTKLFLDFGHAVTGIGPGLDLRNLLFAQGFGFAHGNIPIP